MTGGPAEDEPITPIPQPPVAEPSKLALGERLFSDKRLSRDGTRACITCHDTRSNGADARQHATAPAGSALSFNTLTAFNAALSFRLNWEGTARTLAALAEGSLENSSIMNSNLDEMLGRLRADPEMLRAFDEAYGRQPDRTNLFGAIALYERSVLTPDSRFDRWLAGDESALSAEAASGYRLFKSLGCISCHQGVNVGGNLFERHGIFRPLASPKSEILRVYRASAMSRRLRPISTTAARRPSTTRCGRWPPPSSSETVGRSGGSDRRLPAKPDR